MAELKLVQIRKTFGDVEVVKGVNLAFDSGEFIVFVGPSGCGKSTLLRMIAGLETVTEGTILIDGEDVTRTDPSKRGISMVFQSYALYPHMTVAENMGFGLEMAGIPKDQRREMVLKAAAILHLEPYLDRKPKQLSGGQRQRVAIGRAIVRNPRIFLFDEPLSNLDAELRVRMRMEIAKLHASLGATLVYVTHDQVEAMTLASRIVVLGAGRVEQVGTPMQLYADPDNQFVAGFIGSPKINFLAARPLGRSENGHLAVTVPSLGISQMEVSPRNPVGTLPDSLTLGIRPEHLASRLQQGNITVRIVADFIERLGNVSYVQSTMADGTSLIVEWKGTDTPATGSAIDIGIDPSAVFVFGPDGNRL